MKKAIIGLTCILLLSTGMDSQPFHAVSPAVRADFHFNLREAAGLLSSHFTKKTGCPFQKTEKAVQASSIELPFYHSILLSPYSSFTYYNQTDERWADHLYGGSDPMKKYGCGPTALAMVVTNMTAETVLPPEMADWASENGYFSRGHGSMHSLIPEGAEAFGLTVERLNSVTPDALRMPLYYNKLIVLLMGPGHFTEKGHFIILKGVDEEGNISVADPYSIQNSMKKWPPELLIDELSQSTDSGGPIWVISAAR